MMKVYIVIVTYHTYKDEVDGTEGWKESAGVFDTLEKAEVFVKRSPDYSFKRDAELFYGIYPVELDVHPGEE